MQTLTLSRHYVTVDSRWGRRTVHYRRAGQGPALLLLHQSPQSSREFEPLMTQWAEHFTVIAPDAPGYGESDPLGVSEASLEDFATAIIEFADAIGLQRFGVYGYHTGGGMAVALAHGFPERVSATASNGLVMPTEEELANILANYLPAFTPSWDGSHLSWLWARLREQSIFFPWHDRRLATRMDFPMHNHVSLQKNVLEFLRAGDNYRVAYRAAFGYRAGPVLPQLKVPALITATALDPLARDLERIGARADCVKIECSADTAEALERSFAHLLAYPGDQPPPADSNQPAAGFWMDTMVIDNATHRLRHHGTSPQALVLHDAGGSALTADNLLGAFGDAVAMDLPGHGEAPRSEPGLAAAAEACLATLRQLTAGGKRLWLAGEGAGALVALEAARREPALLAGLLIKDPPLPEAALRQDLLAEGLPELSPDWHGGHLSRAWHMLRDGRLYHPWFRRDRTGIRWSEPELDESRLTLEVREHLVADGYWQALARDSWNQDVASTLAAVKIPVICCSEPASPWHEAADALARGCASSRFLSLPAAKAAWAEAIRPLLAAS